MYRQAETIPTTDHTLNPLEQLFNPTWFHRNSVIEEIRTHNLLKGLQ